MLRIETPAQLKAAREVVVASAPKLLAAARKIVLEQEGMEFHGPGTFGRPARVMHAKPTRGPAGGGDTLQWLLDLREGLTRAFRAAGVRVLEADDIPVEGSDAASSASGSGAGAGSPPGRGGRPYSPHVTLINLRRAASKGLPDGIPGEAIGAAHDAVSRMHGDEAAADPAAATAAGAASAGLAKFGKSLRVADSAWLCSMLLPREDGRFYPTAAAVQHDGSVPEDVPKHEAPAVKATAAGSSAATDASASLGSMERLQEAPWSVVVRQPLPLSGEQRLAELVGLARTMAMAGQKHAMAARAHAKYEWNHERVPEETEDGAYRSYW